MSFLSVVICTLNRSESLRDVLERLAAQSLPKSEFEVVVVDDGSSDGTEVLMQILAAKSPVAIRYLRHERKGPGYTQNRGIREARGPLVLLLCDDIQPDAGLLAAHARWHEEHPEQNVAIVGKVLQSPDLPDTVFLRNWDPFRHASLASHEELTHLYVCGCHISFKKGFMLKYGMFLERRAAAHEDVELGWRMRRDGGLRIFYGQDALAYHNHIETIESACHRALERGRHFDVLATLVPDPGVYIKYHLVTWKTIPLILEGFRSRETVLLDEDRNVFKYFVREAIRRVIFNGIAVSWIFLPLIRGAEGNRLLARFVTSLVLRGVVSYHFLKGYRERRHDIPIPTVSALGRRLGGSVDADFR